MNLVQLPPTRILLTIVALGVAAATVGAFAIYAVDATKEAEDYEHDSNRGTLKVHDGPTADPPRRNEPHVDCDFWVESFRMMDRTGVLVFYAWPPTGDKSVVETSANATWEADESGHFLAGPFSLPTGHYRVESFTDDGHPSKADDGRFAKAKMFWTECEPGPGEPPEESPPDDGPEDSPPDDEPESPPCPSTDLLARANDDGSVTLTWSAVDDADGYNVYRATGDDDFEFHGTTTSTTWNDGTSEVGATYTYMVTTLDDDGEAETCDTAEVTAIPFFGGPALMGLALAGSVGAYAALRRR